MKLFKFFGSVKDEMKLVVWLHSKKIDVIHGPLLVLH